ncbi:YihY/virulence factor BrkB family protein [Agromyces archimandritae]|uniref:YihY/virulence factor BrkB family protein n=1 Tax=Agromyces archimandritae TaxID=2781962 RepID=A0A975FNW3_9MICO|nr:YihY/virulence factor BrkB family protein [Agromyces archimandritae]QTX04933.1 YihY/virulence factor BrkB family protein [Agromyces archimandritae]
MGERQPNALARGIRTATRWLLARKPVRAYLLYQEHHGAMLADSVAYRALFSVFAGVFLGFAIAGVWLAGNPGAMRALTDALDAAVPGLVGGDGLLDPDSLVRPISLSIAGAIALAGLIGTAIGAVSSLRTALRTIADQPDPKGFFLWTMLRDLLLAVGFGAALAVAALVTVAGTAALGIVFDWLGMSTRSGLFDTGTRAISILVTFAIDTLVVAVMFRVLAGLRPRARSLWAGALLGGLGLTVLQVLSGLFVGGATSNPLLASFASLVALLIWFDFSCQVILIAGAYIVTGVEEEHDRVAARYGASTLELRRLQRAERRATSAAGELAAAREAFDRAEGRAGEPRE